ncbi:MAG: ABC transporter ATP-binding protein [Pseudomonadota bacterium]
MSLKVESLTVAYGANRIIQDLSATLPSGQLAVLIGPNGSGKSTLLKGLAGLLSCHGSVSLAGQVLPPEQRRKEVAYMPQDIGAVSALTILEVVLLGRLGRLGMRLPNDLLEAASAALEAFGLLPLATRRLNEVSGGQRQLVYLTQSLFREPQVLLLDEPTAALDLRHQMIVLKGVSDYAHKQGKIVLIAMHDLSLAAQFADTLLCLRDGRIEAAGKVEAVLTEARVEQLYGVEVAIRQSLPGRLVVVPLRASSATPS